ncbi:tRNA (adenosine(37)-N6)-threonylcarbamoyltransferase complex ATPase subunit type 1 TsaE [Pedobacter montanisoli]|uniref:tRNA threonylcarbamoyladenosine biosynthesis protein TsaE n=1 Tax=Pedobacter montanisoli TaxID=2923277 RepID=A0ABS9ZUV5_9SPHI|nr:tRNA (adenosine(37)-N6)-threonylcarbamoyltransferase complex ATPase subunit type 1 TsaE [Pedobacter montanisoli]MCJ0741759.1 tRNA (adenosine(37)-N6)-threonylcarbamoyltransferase complex ATPase subunit type 1 TsaE [Pedobacter montanisoli]
MIIEINSEDELNEVAKSLLKFAQGQKFIVFEGDMAAGKTTFIKAFCKALGSEDIINSPTFSIVNEYDSTHGIIFHFDFYRLKNIQEAYDIGYEEYFYSNLYCLVEWPQKVEELLPDHYIKVKIDLYGPSGRRFEFTRF